jgi:haloacetate dehalogenase
MFEGFTQHRVPANGIEVNLRMKGDGPPLLLLHGFPQSHVMWHRVAPALAEHFTVVCADLRGYGDSSKPPGGGDHMAYSKRTMALDMVEAMRALGFEQWSLAGHDRGGRVSYRMAFDHPERITRLATLDIIPTHAQWRRLDWRASMGSYHWYFLAQPAPMPERLIGSDPVFYLHHLLPKWAASGFGFDPAAMAEYERCYSDPGTIHGSCEDYRAGATVDVAIDEADYGKRKITCPMLAIWGQREGGPDRGFVETWREWAEDVRGLGITSGHFLPEEAPGPTLAALLDFFGT